MDVEIYQDESKWWRISFGSKGDSSKRSQNRRYGDEGDRTLAINLIHGTLFEDDLDAQIYLESFFSNKLKASDMFSQRSFSDKLKVSESN